jgi:hypothetical protein
MVGKHAKATFLGNEHRSKEFLELVHLDVCGSMSTTSISISMYDVSFINEFSHKTWVYFLKYKDEFF